MKQGKSQVSNSSESKTFKQPSSADVEALNRKANAAAANPKGASVSKKR